MATRLRNTKGYCRCDSFFYWETLRLPKPRSPLSASLKWLGKQMSLSNELLYSFMQKIFRVPWLRRLSKWNLVFSDTFWIHFYSKTPKIGSALIKILWNEYFFFCFSIKTKHILTLTSYTIFTKKWKTWTIPNHFNCLDCKFYVSVYKNEPVNKQNFLFG